jgi:hypothetical protein
MIDDDALDDMKPPKGGDRGQFRDGSSVRVDI